MSNYFNHFVITRFNLAFADRPQPSDEWLKSRLEIFSQTLLPSMVAQTQKKFKWIILCSNTSPDWFIDEINELVGTTGTALFMEGPFCPAVLSEKILTFVSEKFVITTRIDNDDVVANNFVEIVQSLFHEQELEFINFTHGAQYSDGYVFHRSDPSNAFCSLVERVKSGSIRTVFLDWHTKIGHHGKVRQVSVAPLWIQVVHGQNLANAVHGVRANPSIMANFTMKLPLRSIGNLTLAVLAATDVVRLAWRVVQKPHRVVWLMKVAARR